jgi:mannosyltransferase OCH1-like enzyme
VLWVKQAFEVKLYACAADYIRLYAVYLHGGIYLDMDMEVVKPFDELLKKDLMLAYENHLGRNVEAGCFGAEANHPYIKECMDYFEQTAFFKPELLPKILELPRTKQHRFIDPMILPEVMKNAAEKYFPAGEEPFYPPDYFTAKNVMTGKIEATENTFTIHHFASHYHSEEWRNNRNAEQKIRAAFGEKTILTRCLVGLLSAKGRIKHYGLFTTLRYYIDRFVLRKTTWKALDI